MKFPIIGGLAFFLSGAAALAAVALMSPSASGPPAAPAVSTGKTSQDSTPGTLVLSVPDMHCEFACAPKVRETLAAVPGVEKVETDVEKQTATLFTSSAFEVERALAALNGAGYPAKAAR